MCDLDRRIPMLPPQTIEATVSILSEVIDYNHRLMNIPAVWRRTRGAGVKVAILDTGLPKHVDLLPAGGKSFIPRYVQDAQGHALHTGGIIAATAGNNMGIAGIAPDAEDHYGVVLDSTGAGTVNQIISGIRWATDELGAHVINMSLGISGADTIPELERVCQYAVDQGVTLFAAAGNDSGPVNQPACYDCVYAVSAIDKHMSFAKFSSRGREVEFCAGGVNVFSTYLNNRYARMSGTSQACPAVAGAAALIISDALMSAHPRKLTPAEVGDKLRKIAYDIGPDGRDIYTGVGIPVFNGDPHPTVRTALWRRLIGLFWR